MPYVPSVIKQPAESRLFTMEFAALLATGETLAGVTSVTDDPTGTLTLTGETYSGSQASVRIAGGTDGVTYKITFVVTTSAGNTLEAEGLLKVEDL